MDLDVKNNPDSQIIKVNVKRIEDSKIIRLIVEGNDNKQIGGSLFIAEGTVKNIFTEIISKLQVKDRTQLAVFAVKNN